MTYEFKLKNKNNFYILCLYKILNSDLYYIYTESSRKIISHLQIDDLNFHSKLNQYHGELFKRGTRPYEITTVKFETEQDGLKFINDYLEPLVIMNQLSQKS